MGEYIVYFYDHPDGSAGVQTLRLEEWQAWADTFGWRGDSTNPAHAQIKVIGVFPDFQTAMKIVAMTYPD